MTRPRRAPMVRVLASNLHVGGGVQVAASLVTEIARMREDAGPVAQWEMVFELSPEVAAGVPSRVLAGVPHLVESRRPWSWHFWLRDLRRRSDVALVIFGPIYCPIRSRRLLSGYADVTSVHPMPLGLARPGLTARGKQRVRGVVSRSLARRCDELIVETDAMKAQVVSALGARAPRVSTISNTVSREVIEGRGEAPATVLDRREAENPDHVFLFTTADYPHKNLEFLPLVAAALFAYHSLRVRFIVTLPDQAYAQRSGPFRETCWNAGPVRVDQIRRLHALSDGVIFPSLLEAFSATPVEAMALGSPLFASDRDFVRTTCHEAAIYIDPLDAVAAADVIASAMGDPDLVARKVDLGRQIVATLPTSSDRAHAFVERIADHLTDLAQS